MPSALYQHGPASREAAPGRSCKPSGAQGSAFTHAQTPDSGARGASGLPRLHAPQGAILRHHRTLSLPTHTPATLPRQAGGHTYLRVQVLAWGGVCSGATEIRTASAVQDTQTRLGFLPLQHFTHHHFTLTRKHTHTHTRRWEASVFPPLPCPEEEVLENQNSVEGREQRRKGRRSV